MSDSKSQQHMPQTLDVQRRRCVLILLLSAALMSTGQKYTPVHERTEGTAYSPPLKSSTLRDPHWPGPTEAARSIYGRLTAALFLQVMFDHLHISDNEHLLDEKLFLMQRPKRLTRTV